MFENCFIKSLEESLKINTFHEKYEISWRKLIRYIFKQFTDGMKFEKKEELKLEKQKSLEKKKTLEKQKTLERQISLKQQKSMDKPKNF